MSKSARETAKQFVHWVIGAQSSNDSSSWDAEPIEKITQALESRDKRIAALREALIGFRGMIPIVDEMALSALAADDKAAEG